MEITFDESSVDFVLDALELDTDEEGYIITRDGHYAAVSDGKEKLHKDEVGDFEHNEDYPQDVLLVPDTFPELVDHTKRVESDEEVAETAMEDFLTSVAEAEHNKQMSSAYKKLILIAGVVLALGIAIRRLRKN